jgi:hypothetical protein
MRTSLALGAAALLLMAHAPVHAQEVRGPALYKVEFSIREGSGPASKVRRYSLLTTADRKATFKVGNRVPAATGSFQPGSGQTVSTQYTYLDVGVDIECIVGDMNGKLGLHGNIDISSIMQHPAATQSSNPPNPTVAQTKLQLDTAVEVGKPTIVAAIDDPETMRQFQVEALVTRVN